MNPTRLIRGGTWFGLVLTLSTPYLSAAPIDKQQWIAAQPTARSTPSSRAVTLSTASAAYIEFALDDTGRFTIGTVAGDPVRAGDDNKRLIFGHPSPGTSNTMVRVDGINYSIHGAASSNVSAIADGLSVTLTTANVQVEERLTVVTSQATGNPDAVRIYFKVTNTDSVSHTVSLRTQLDTELGNNDGAPFRIPSIGEVTHDREFTPASNVPAQALVLDNLVAPEIVALFSFKPTGFQSPDRVVFGYWPDSVSVYDYTVDPTNNFLDHNNDGTISGSSPDSDSSLIVYWGYPGIAYTLGPGASKEFAIDYGMGNCTAGAGAVFSVLLCAPASIEGQVSGASYSYTPVTVSAFLTNGSGGTATGALATLNLTPDLQLMPGYGATRAIESTVGGSTVAAGASTQLDWQITSNARHLGLRRLSLTVNAGSDHSNLLRDITTKTIPGALYGVATDPNGQALAGATITVYQGSSVVGSATTQSDGSYVVLGLPPGDYTVRLTVGGRPDSYFPAFVSASADAGRTGNPGSFVAGSQLSTYAYPNPVREGSSHITFFTETSQSVDVEIFTTAGQLVKTLSLATPGAGWHTVDWPIDRVANGVYLYQVKSGSNRARGKIAVLKRRGL